MITTTTHNMIRTKYILFCCFVCLLFFLSLRSAQCDHTAAAHPIRLHCTTQPDKQSLQALASRMLTANISTTECCQQNTSCCHNVGFELFVLQFFQSREHIRSAFLHGFKQLDFSQEALDLINFLPPGRHILDGRNLAGNLKQ